jgi:hypothetical protein
MDERLINDNLNASFCGSYFNDGLGRSRTMPQDRTSEPHDKVSLLGNKRGTIVIIDSSPLLERTEGKSIDAESAEESMASLYSPVGFSLNSLFWLQVRTRISRARGGRRRRTFPG